MAKPNKLSRKVEVEETEEEILHGMEESPPVSMRENGWNILWDLQRLELTADAKNKRVYQDMLRLGLQFFNRWHGVTRRRGKRD